MALYPNWLILYVLRVVIPMLMLVLVAIKILIKSGRDIQRAFDIHLMSNKGHNSRFLAGTVATLPVHYDCSAAAPPLSNSQNLAKDQVLATLPPVATLH